MRFGNDVSHSTENCRPVKFGTGTSSNLLSDGQFRTFCFTSQRYPDSRETSESESKTAPLEKLLKFVFLEIVKRALKS
jgi:hypothetical protein